MVTIIIVCVVLMNAVRIVIYSINMTLGIIKALLAASLLPIVVIGALCFGILDVTVAALIVLCGALIVGVAC